MGPSRQRTRPDSDLTYLPIPRHAHPSEDIVRNLSLPHHHVAPRLSLRPRLPLRTLPLGLHYVVIHQHPSSSDLGDLSNGTKYSPRSRETKQTATSGMMKLTTFGVHIDLHVEYVAEPAPSVIDTASLTPEFSSQYHVVPPKQIELAPHHSMRGQLTCSGHKSLLGLRK